jgi:predicted dithiol-disulfide oxidoreductase (DUF899 family)
MQSENEPMTFTFPNETQAYRAARDRLLAEEIELRRTMEVLAAARRGLPPGGEVPQDYIFQGLLPDGAQGDVRLSELFAPGKDSLVIYNMMFPRHPKDDRPGPTIGATAQLPLSEGPCPSCTSLLDQLDGAAPHVEPRANMVIVAKAPLPRLLAFAGERGWRHLRFVSSAGNSFNRDYGGEDVAALQQPMLNVFHRNSGIIRHFWGSEMLYAPAEPGQDPRHVGTIEPLWNIFDLIPEGRGGDWDEQFAYPCYTRDRA